MRKIRGGQLVKRGLYFDVLNREFFYVNDDNQELPGPPEHLYISLNIIEQLFFALCAGAAYVLFIPLVGWVIVGYAAFVHVMTFIAQKVLCKLIKKICEAEHWLCVITNRMCKQCGKECDDNVTMLVKGFVLAMFLLVGMAIGKYFLP
jgi:hypothetical protein